MTGRINKSGYLVLRRVNREVFVRCPFVTPDDSIADGRMKHCGDWCPLFDEPVIRSLGDAEIMLCQSRNLYLKEFKDERT